MMDWINVVAVSLGVLKYACDRFIIEAQPLHIEENECLMSLIIASPSSLGNILCIFFFLAQVCNCYHGQLVVRLVCFLRSRPPKVEFVCSLRFLPKSKCNKLPLNLNVWVDCVFAPGWTADLSRVPSRLSPGDCWDGLQCHGDPWNLFSVTESSCKR